MDVSVITVTHRRLELLTRKAVSLAAQTLEPDRFEWRVWVNGDEVERSEVQVAFGELGLPFAVHVDGGSVLPVGAARNAAAAAARAPLLLLSDDDVRLDPPALQAFAAHHAARPRDVIIGRLRLPGALREGREVEPFERVFNVGGRAHWMNATGAHTAVPADAYDAAGGYDPHWTGYGGEDPELFIRLADAGLRFRFAAAATAEHHGRVTHDTIKARFAGRAHVSVARRHPQRLSAWWLGVHPILLGVKRALYAGPFARVWPRGTLAYERAFARGAREAWSNSDARRSDPAPPPVREDPS